MRKEDIKWKSTVDNPPKETDESRYGEILVSGPNQKDCIWMNRKTAIKNPSLYPFWKRAYHNDVMDLLTAESNAILRIPIYIESYEKAIDLIHYHVHFLKGRLITSGIGKAGQIAHNLATTFASTGTPAYYLNPVEAMHGDLGIIAHNDVMLIVSNSGITEELVELVHAANAMMKKIPIILITGHYNELESTLSRTADVTLFTGNPPEVCPLGLTPTTSITCMSVIGDILITMMMEKIHFTAKDYYERHHGGYLGQKSKEQMEE